MSLEGSNAIRKRAQRRYPVLGPCHCGEQAVERHHPRLDQPNRVVPLCRICHVRRHPQPRDSRGRWTQQEAKP